MNYEFVLIVDEPNLKKCVIEEDNWSVKGPTKNLYIIDVTHYFNICAPKLNRNRKFFNRCTISWTIDFNRVNT